MRVDSYNGGAGVRAGGGVRLVYGGRCWPEADRRLFGTETEKADLRSPSRKTLADFDQETLPLVISFPSYKRLKPRNCRHWINAMNDAVAI